MKRQLWQKKRGGEGKIYMLSNLSAIFEEHDLGQDERIATIIFCVLSQKLPCRQILSNFPNPPDAMFVLFRNPFTVKAEDVPKTVQK